MDPEKGTPEGKPQLWISPKKDTPALFCFAVFFGHGSVESAGSFFVGFSPPDRCVFLGFDEDLGREIGYGDGSPCGVFFIWYFKYFVLWF